MSEPLLWDDSKKPFYESWRFVYEIDAAFDRLERGEIAQQWPGYVWQEYYDGDYYWTPEGTCDEIRLDLPDLRDT